MTVGQNVELTISGNAITTNASAALHFINGSPVTLMNNVMNSMGALGVKGTNSIAHLAAFENAVGAGSLFDFNPTNGISSNAFGAGGLGINVAAPTSPLDVYAAGVLESVCGHRRRRRIARTRLATSAISPGMTTSCT